MPRPENRLRRGIVYNDRLLGHDKVEFSRHALRRMKQRRVTREEIYNTIRNPDEVGLPGPSSRQHVRKIFGRHAIDVVYELKTDRVRVITTYKNHVDTPKGVPPKILRTKTQRRTKPRQKNPQRRGRKR